MTPTNQGSFRLFRLAGIELYLHWSWFLVAYYGISQRLGTYTSPVWNVLEYLALFGLVLTHEFGHALACRQVGGRADRSAAVADGLAAGLGARGEVELA